MNMTRKTFCASLAGSTVTLLLQGCGGGGYSSGGTPSAGSTCGASGGDISANHGHVLTIPKVDLDSLVAIPYNLSASIEGHTHGVTFAPSDFATLKGGGSVTVTSTTTVASASYGGTHFHGVTATVMTTCP
jgi:hypothetical protein